MSESHCGSTTRLPREKLMEQGATALSDQELLAVMLGRGTRGLPVQRLARRLLKLMDRHEEPSLDHLLALRGIGVAKATLVAAAMEFARRRIHPAGLHMQRPRDLLAIYRHYADRQQPYLLCTSLNGAQEVMATRIVARGATERLEVEAQQIFADPLAERACQVILASNRSGRDLLPSTQDMQVTRQWVKIGDLLNVRVLDHLIFNDRAYFSFRENDILREPLRLIDGTPIARPGTLQCKMFPLPEDPDRVSLKERGA